MKRLLKQIHSLVIDIASKRLSAAKKIETLRELQSHIEDVISELQQDRNVFTD